ncbi:hypothetical protein FRZ67_08825 [Panacibacter ginsenosidivorans]|uniref:Uncharacterized protein n=1 Tax=Panacibacter ginsenosidivorans TaxID=1813871 RepID=A0A5B8V7J1_9BACT|nr:hypothetical protein [Panacibacter ginsenosidivorans]QEC67394.1 hypothetical protein FRZ67_08825 [Panacibacter ginsenosidivorans]
MIRSIFKPILIGILAGAALFFFGFFVLRVLLFFFIISAIIRFFVWRRWRRGYSRFSAYQHMRPTNMYNDTVIHLRRKNESDPNIISID